MRTSAAERSISDVALAKQCRKVGVPVPPCGYWNRLQAGKAVVAKPLPPLPPTLLQQAGLGETFPALKAAHPESPDDHGDGPRRPQFVDTVELIRRIKQTVGDVQISGRPDR